MKTRTDRLAILSLGVGAALALASAGRAAEEMFDFETLRFRAKLIAAKPYVAPASRVPDWLLKLDYDQHRFIRFEDSRAWWRGEGRSFQVQFFHPGFIFNKTIQLSEVQGKKAEPIAFDPHFFSYGSKLRVGPLPPKMGYAGFKLMYPLNLPNDELGAFLGASYFRLLCQKAVYGLSARGLALNTGEPGGEEFPVFTEFWLERPASGAKSLTLYALLESDSVAGAYRFVIIPGADTVTQVKAAVYCRPGVKTFGIAPLTSMYWHGENSGAAPDDFRPEVHDSDGLMLFTGAGEWLWRPLTNPRTMRLAAFGDDNPRGFGLVQRDRKFDSYQDLEASYHQRPSAWVEPVGAWGRGSVRLLELPTSDETNDNIVAFWAPDRLPPPGEPVEFEYRLHWYLDQINPPAGKAVATRHGRSRTHEPDLERFFVDFDGTYLSKQGADPAIEPEVTVGEGAKLTHTSVQKNPFNGTWRVAFSLRPDGSGRPVELRCFLRKTPHVLTETWSYLWQP